VYEEICREEKGMGGVVMLAWWIAMEWLERWRWALARGRSADAAKQGGSTQLVNAASVAGLKDEKKMGACVVEI
jgi:hypothetical protein